MAIDHYWTPLAKDYLGDHLDSIPSWRGRRQLWHCPFCGDHSLTISRADRISCANDCVDSVTVVGFAARYWDCSIEEAARTLGCWINERPAGRAPES